MLLANIFSGFLGFFTPQDRTDIFQLSHENYKNEVIEYEGPVVVLYSLPSSLKTGISKQLGYTEKAFSKSAKHFSGKVKYAYFDLGQCLERSRSLREANAHLRSYHDLNGFPTVILYQSGSFSTSFDKELTRIETGIPFQRAIKPYVKTLDFLVQNDLVEVKDVVYIVEKDGYVRPVQRNNNPSENNI